MQKPRVATRHRKALPLALAPALVCVALAARAAPVVPDAVKQPGTQPNEVSAYVHPDNCSTCHAGTPNPEFEPATGWQGSMMAHSSRDPLFWAALAVVEQNVLPDADPDLRGGAGDFCLRCHMPNGWLQGRSTPTDGSALQSPDDVHGVECEHCHLLVNPDPPTNVLGTIEEQTAPFLANDGADGWYGSGMYVVNSEGSRLGPYDNAAANHAWKPSAFHRDAAMCGTCHDVSNPLVGDLAHNNGAQQPLAPGTFSGALAGPVTGRAAFNNPPHAYGVAERTYSEWKASAFPSLRVNDFSTLPADLKTTGGSIEVAHDRSWRPGDGTADYVDYTPRYYTCQTCHMAASEGKGCRQPQGPVRTDLPRHDLTGGSYWAPDAIVWQDDAGTLRFGGGLTADQKTAMTAGQTRAVAMLQSAALLEASDAGSSLDVRVTNLTGHKLISGYPEGRRMWLDVRWYDAPAGTGNLIAEDGAYGPIGRTVQDLHGQDCDVESLIDPASTVIFETKPGIDQQWAVQLLGLGLPGGLVLAHDRVTDAPTETLATLAAKPAGSKTTSFHFALNNVGLGDNRIPPYQFSYDLAQEFNALPEPPTQFGNPGPGGTYEHWSDHTFGVPVGAQSAVVTLYYQQTSWEYIQFLWLQNDGQNASLGDEGANLLDAWCNTGRSAPLPMASTTVELSGASGPGEASRQPSAPDQMLVGYDKLTGEVSLIYTPACDATDHTIYWGPLADVSTYAYAGAQCNAGATGAAVFTPGAGDQFFVIVGNNGIGEGSYGSDSTLTPRPEDSGTPGCDIAQVPGACDP